MLSEDRAVMQSKQRASHKVVKLAISFDCVVLLIHWS